MKFVFLLIHLKDDFSLLAGTSPYDPLGKELSYAHDSRIAVDQDIEVTREDIFQLRETEKLCHQGIKIRASLTFDTDLQTVKVRLITDIVDLFDLTGLDQFGDLVDNSLSRSRIRDLGHFDQVIFLIGKILRTDADRSFSRFIDRTHRGLIVKDNASAREIRRGHDLQDIRSRILHVGDRRFTDFLDVEGADVRSHTGRDTLVTVYEDRRVCRGKEYRLLHRAVVVINKIDRIFIQALEEFLTEFFEAYLRISRCRVLHITGVLLTEVTLGINVRMQERSVTSCQTDHGLIDRGIAVRIEFHGLTDNVTGLGAVALQKSHLVHRVKKFSVRWLKTVDLRDRTRYDDTHRIRHEVRFQGIVNILKCRIRRRKSLGLALQGVLLRCLCYVFFTLSCHVRSLFLNQSTSSISR